MKKTFIMLCCISAISYGASSSSSSRGVAISDLENITPNGVSNGHPYPIEDLKSTPSPPPSAINTSSMRRSPGMQNLHQLDVMAAEPSAQIAASPSYTSFTGKQKKPSGSVALRAPRPVRTTSFIVERLEKVRRSPNHDSLNELEERKSTAEESALSLEKFALSLFEDTSSTISDPEY